jgi:hypothetical protein
MKEKPNSDFISKSAWSGFYLEKFVPLCFQLLLVSLVLRVPVVPAR